MRRFAKLNRDESNHYVTTARGHQLTVLAWHLFGVRRELPARRLLGGGLRLEADVRVRRRCLARLDALS